MADGSLQLTLEEEIRKKYIQGHSLADLCKMYSLPRFTIAQVLNHPSVDAHTTDRLTTVRRRVVAYRLRAFEGAEDALESLIDLLESSQDETVRRHVANDLIRVAGLEPRKVLEVKGQHDFGIDAESKEWLREIFRESGIHNSGNIIEGEKLP
jgi:hypothetical protein